MSDPRLDRRIQFDDRSRAFPIRALLGASQPLRSYTWTLDTHLNQGSEGACVGFSWAHELAARPVAVLGVTDDDARMIYRSAQKIDEWPGEDYEGTSVLAGAKTVHDHGFMDEYRWAFSLDDVLQTIGRHGPVVLGINWYDSMFDPDSNGLLTVKGGVAGGHAILANGISAKRERIRLENSWGIDWGIEGHAFLSFTDLERLLKEDGEACVPVKRQLAGTLA